MGGVFYPVGTKVRLASGGPEMIVVDIDPRAAKATCAWRSGNRAEEYQFPTVCLDLVRSFHIIDDREA